MTKEPGKFIVSLDFELMWGVRDVVGPAEYGDNIRGVHTALPAILDYFTKYDIKGTFAAVGFLFFEDKKNLLEYLPVQKPAYTDNNLSPYGNYMDAQVGQNFKEDPYHFGLHLIKKIKDTPGQEIGTHTFSHFYCLEPGQTAEGFRQDIAAAVAAAKRQDISITSIIFPRNQVNESYLGICAEMGIITYRSNEESWIYSARAGEKESLLRRCVRLTDTYLNISGHHCYSDEYMKTAGPLINIPSSRFLRPYTRKLGFLEGLRLRRIKNGMTHAAKNGLTYHIWWHPHNFGVSQDKNFLFLEKILQHYTHLHEKYNFSSHTMSEVARMMQ